MPNQLRRIMAAARPKRDWTRSYFRAYMILLPFSDTFFYLSSVINPLLYNVSSRQFRRVFAQVLRCRLSLQHANHERRLRARALSTAGTPRSIQRPLLRRASWRGASARRPTQAFLSTFQSEAKPESRPQSPEPNSGTKPAGAAAENGFQEHEV
ncbi:G-protein coupled receptor 39 [Carlito syrichta]|uniref:G-protein coupled receptor 39 n=1 Tax=Carlito syrichta TaxID=1868482 RepID=A0A1U7T6L2_CARSF|nr:G-protein coupled receptor 39 [Carlito syrichta]